MAKTQSKSVNTIWIVRDRAFRNEAAMGDAAVRKAAIGAAVTHESVLPLLGSPGQRSIAFILFYLFLKKKRILVEEKKKL
jgi:hypothetical protein